MSAPFNVWMLGAAAMLVALVPCAVVCFRGSALNRLVGLETAAVIVTMALLLLAQAMDRPAFYGLSLTLALLSFGGGLVFARFFERWL